MKLFKTILTGAVFACAPILAIAADKAAPAFNVLVFSKTNGFRHHGAIAAGTEAFKKLGEKYNFAVTASEDASLFTDENLKKYQAVILLNTTGAFLSDRLAKNAKSEEKAAAKERDLARREAFRKFVEKGGAVVGLHAATDGYQYKDQKWPEFWKIIGGSFLHHPHHQTSTIEIVDKTHPATIVLSNNSVKKATKTKSIVKDGKWECFDEWYNFQNLQRDNHILLQVDLKTCKGCKTSVYIDGEKLATLPFSWTRSYGKGKVFYTARGHYGEAFSDIDYVRHVVGGLFWAVGQTAPLVDPSVLPSAPVEKKRK
ncbi:MAG: ThuA domain-containing protein [Puniceicoccales bacterium]|jgi:type 1 glutamine amidotransferase|nr:ThuA domain-containing protein [Puniceicoccales bacterium]